MPPIDKELDWTEKEMDIFLEPTVSDFEQCERLWEEAVDPVFIDLLFATVDFLETSKS